MSDLMKGDFKWLTEEEKNTFNSLTISDESNTAFI